MIIYEIFDVLYLKKYCTDFNEIYRACTLYHKDHLSTIGYKYMKVQVQVDCVANAVLSKWEIWFIGEITHFYFSTKTRYISTKNAGHVHYNRGIISVHNDGKYIQVQAQDDCVKMPC